MRALFSRCRQEHLARRIGEYRGANIAPFDHVVAARADALLLRNERFTHRRRGRNRRDRLVDLGVRMTEVTSVPSMNTRRGIGSLPSCSKAISHVRASSPSAAASARSIPSSSAFHAIARYIAPVSKHEKPSLRATALATVDLPAPEGPSIATILEQAFQNFRGTAGSSPSPNRNRRYSRAYCRTILRATTS